MQLICKNTEGKYMKKIHLFSFFIVIIGAIIMAVSFRQQTWAPKDSDTLSIVTSFYPLYFFTKEIVGDTIRVENMTPSGSEPHDYEPTAQQIASMEKSDLIILQGGKLEPWGDDAISTYGTKVLLAGEIQTIADPHTWLDPVMAKKIVQKISQSIEALDPPNASLYQERAHALLTQLSNLDDEYKDGLSSCQRRDFITSHAAFGHLAKQYNLNQLSISGISPDEEPTAKDMARVITFAKSQDISYIFFERLVSPKLADTIAGEIGAKTMVLDPIEGITEQQLKEGVNYFTIMRENLKALQTALQCQT
jgi:zinc transport system substrate-binding protein